MDAKIIFVLCAQALLAQLAFSQCCGLGSLGGIGLGGGLGGCGCGGVSSTGGNFPVISSSPNSPTGISVQSENQYEGNLCLGGNIPFLGTVALEGQVPTGGSSSVCYSCGSDSVGITNELGNAGIASPGPGSLGCCGCGGRW